MSYVINGHAHKLNINIFTFFHGKGGERKEYLQNINFKNIYMYFMQRAQ